VRRERGNYGFHPLRDSYTADGVALSKALMSDEAPDGWLVLNCHNAYAFGATWHEMFEQGDMVAYLVGTLVRFYGTTLQLEQSTIVRNRHLQPASRTTELSSQNCRSELATPRPTGHGGHRMARSSGFRWASSCLRHHTILILASSYASCQHCSAISLEMRFH
jgi:hypothetical protein